jgi:hypothetical protein
MDHGINLPSLALDRPPIGWRSAPAPGAGRNRVRAAGARRYHGPGAGVRPAAGGAARPVPAAGFEAPTALRIPIKVDLSASVVLTPRGTGTRRRRRGWRQIRTSGFGGLPPGRIELGPSHSPSETPAGRFGRSTGTRWYGRHEWSSRASATPGTSATRKTASRTRRRGRPSCRLRGRRGKRRSGTRRRVPLL